MFAGDWNQHACFQDQHGGLLESSVVFSIHYVAEEKGKEVSHELGVDFPNQDTEASNRHVDSIEHHVDSLEHQIDSIEHHVDSLEQHVDSS
jgi:hypothetical protein